MAPFTIHTGSSMFRLAAALNERLAANPAPPLVRETVVVLSNGMGRWLAMQTAATRGVSAGLEFRFPNDTLDACFRGVIPDLPESSPYALDSMAWRIAGLLPGYLDRPGFEPLAAYLGDRSDDRRLLQLSRVLADTFDQYTIYRPHMVLRWDAGDENDWQAELWRALGRATPGLHRAALLNKFRKCLSAPGFSCPSLPRRLSLFGISFLPPFHLDFLSILSAVCEIDFYLFTPCNGYWGDLLSERRITDLALERELPSEALEFYETGNPLLSSLGTQGQEFFSLLLELDTEWAEESGQGPPAVDSLLHQLQQDILLLNNRGVSAPRFRISADDRSVQIHSCHGPLREMETLYDNLLRLFEDSPGLEPRDICVMTPDIGAYAPYITATFGTRCGGRPAIPFTIADQSQHRENPLLAVFLRTLELPDGRFGINSILELLECPQVMARFNLSAADTAAIREWLRASGVRWGLDAAHREELGFPGYDDFSWQAGLDRLLLGYALEPEGDQLFSGIMPCAVDSGSQTRALGKLTSFVHEIRGLSCLLAGRRPLEAWADTLADLTSRLFAPLDGNDTACTPLFTAFQKLRDTERLTGFHSPVSLEAVSDTLKGLLESPGNAFGFLGGRVTFCAMLPMRSIPMKVVCLVGMNDGVFPRSQRLPSFSRLNGSRRRGDRSLRDEDRYLFLEALLSAEEILYISYTGQSDRDNDTLPPSVVVSELQDYIRRGFVTGSGDDAPDIVVRHRLQSFSSDYFTGAAGSRLFSYAPELLQALERRTGADRNGRVFLSAPLADDPELWSTVDIRDLIRFLHNPAAFFLARRLKVFPKRADEEILEREPFSLEPLPGYALRQQLTGSILGGGECGDLYPSFRARGLLPPQDTGRYAFETALAESRAFAARISPELGNSLPDLAVDCAIDGTRLTGTIGGIRAGRHLRWRCAGVKGKDLLTIWCEHLVLNTVQSPGYPRDSILICRDGRTAFAPRDNAADLLRDLITLYREGLRQPLHFFPQTSWLYLEKGMAAAEGRWSGSDFSPAPAESADPACELCFSGTMPLDNDFKSLAARVFGPLRDATAEGGVA